MACKICYHPELEDIEQELAEGAQYHRVAKYYGCDRHSVRYHAEHCMSEELRTQRFNVLRERLEKRVEKLEQREHLKTQRLTRVLAEDLLEAVSNPHIPHR